MKSDPLFGQLLRLRRHDPARLRRLVDALDRLCLQPVPPWQTDVYLQHLLAGMQQLLDACAVAFWYRCFGGSSLVIGPHLGMQKMRLSTTTRATLDESVQRFWQRNCASHVQSPDGSTAIIVAPVNHGLQTVATFTFLFSRSNAAFAQSQENLEAANHLQAAIQSSLHAALQLPTVDPRANADPLEQLTSQVHLVQRSIRQTIELYLNRRAGEDLGDVTAMQSFATQLHELLDAHGLRVRCPECGHAAILRCSGAATDQRSNFVFDHYIDGRRTFHGAGSLLPRLRILNKPPRRKRASATSG